MRSRTVEKSVSTCDPDAVGLFALRFCYSYSTAFLGFHLIQFPVALAVVA